MIANMLLSLDSRVKLNNGVEIPYLGLGVYQSPPGRITQRVVKYALKIGYRHIDTAMVYGNEADVGSALRESEIRRDEAAKKYGNKTPAQVLICWSLQHGLVVIPKSLHEDRIWENSQVFDFQLAPEDMKILDSLNQNLQTVFLG
jgi:diketogulonate reductase-like aldo/keto reductase